MDSFSRQNLRFFDHDDDFTVVLKNLPHWTQAATITFITWRLSDSLPIAAIADWQKVRNEMLRQHGIDPDTNWKDQLRRLPAEKRGQLRWKLFFAWDRRLDEAVGSCLLKDPEYSQMVLDSLLYFDGDRTVLTDAVIMPNHIHLLAAFRKQEMMFTQCTSWKHFTATEIRRRLRSRKMISDTAATPNIGLSGQFWQTDQFDHLVRSEEQFGFLKDYIAKNPIRTKLKRDEYLHYSRDL